ncbi:MAG: hypothetical protein ABJG86_09710 [Nitratireductor sp.]
MMDRIRAREQIAAIETAALGSGSLKKSDAWRAMARIERAAQGGHAARVQATPDMLAAAGIAVVHVGPGGAHNG